MCRTLWKFQWLDVISLEKPQWKWASSRRQGRTSWIFSSCDRCSRLTTGTSGTRSGGLRKGQSPCDFHGGLTGFLSCGSRGLRPCVDSGPEPEVSPPVLTWTVGYFWSLPRGVSPRLECGHALALSSRAVAAVSRSPPRGSKDLWLSLEAFPRGIPIGLSHVPPWRESTLGMIVELVRGKHVPLNGLTHLGDSWNGGTTLEFLSPFLWRAPPLKMRRECREFFDYETGRGSLISS